MRLTCPICTESEHLEEWPFVDDDGQARLRLTCRAAAHPEPVVAVYADPDAPAPGQLANAGGLAGELELYTKLQEVVDGLDGWVEHGVFEHLFAAQYPGDYRTLWERFGHVATHGSKQYTLSAYLARRLGDLTREGTVAHRTVSGTGRWAYNGNDLSAWAHPSRTSGEVRTWAGWAEAHGISPQDWPATADMG